MVSNKYVKHLLHGLSVYTAAVLPQLLAEKPSSALLVSLVPGLVAVIISALLPQVDAAKVEKAVEEVLAK